MEEENNNLIAEYVKRRAKRRFFRWLFLSGTGLTIILSMVVGLFLLVAMGNYDDSGSGSEGVGEGGAFTGEYSEDLPSFKDVKGRGPITDEMAQYAMGAAVKYRLLPSVILSQFGWESAYGTSSSGRNDTNFFGITWFSGCPFPQGSARGVGGSEGGFYMKFPNAKACFSYYGYMVATQSNFNQCVGNKDPGNCLLILGRGGYAAAGITESSAYYQGAMGIINSLNLKEYDAIAISKWGSAGNNSGGSGGVSNQKIVAIAQKEIESGSHVGGAKYWSWYGWGGRVEWCACFVSYCADQAGLIASGQVPKHASCAVGVSWFSQRGKYQPATSGYKPKAGDIIYFDWSGGRTGSHHVAIVESADGNTVNTIEGNSGDQLARRSYNSSDVVISGYGQTK